MELGNCVMVIESTPRAMAHPYADSPN